MLVYDLISQVEDAILDRLKAKLENRILIQPYPDNPESYDCLLYTSPSPRDRTRSRMPSSA
jgi:hypothetical protein